MHTTFVKQMSQFAGLFESREGTSPVTTRCRSRHLRVYSSDRVCPCHGSTALFNDFRKALVCSCHLCCTSPCKRPLCMSRTYLNKVGKHKDLKNPPHFVPSSPQSEQITVVLTHLLTLYQYHEKRSREKLMRRLQVTHKSVTV